MNDASDSVSEAVDGVRGIWHVRAGRFVLRVDRRLSSQPELRCSGSGGVGEVTVMRDMTAGVDWMKVSPPPGRRRMVERNHLPSDRSLCESCCTQQMRPTKAINMKTIEDVGMSHHDTSIRADSRA